MILIGLIKADLMTIIQGHLPKEVQLMGKRQR